MPAPYKNKIGLSLSGGGYRAAAFHLGTLKKLNDMGILERVEILSTISGGSITGAYYCLHRENFSQFYAQMYQALHTKNVVSHVFKSATFLRFLAFILVFLLPATYTLLTGKIWIAMLLLAAFITLLLKFQFLLFPVSREIEKIYDQFFFTQKTLKDLPLKPKLVIGATNLQTGRPFTFSPTRMQDSAYRYAHPPIEFRHEDFPIARAVMASSCVPFAFTPVTIDPHFFKNPQQAESVHPLLVDGGVFDNQGIHKISRKGAYNSDIVITSEAGGGSGKELSITNTLSLLAATVETFMARIKRFQMMDQVYENTGSENREIAYISLAWDAEKCIPGFINNLEKKQIADKVIQALELQQAWVDHPHTHEAALTEHLKQKTSYASLDLPTDEERHIARTVGTNLTALRNTALDCLIKQAEVLTQIQVSLYCPSLIATP